MKSKVIALSAVSAGFTAICLIVGAYLDFADLIALVLASAFVILPLYYGSYKGAALAFLAGGTIALLIALPKIALTIVFPAYAAFFGLYPIIRHFAAEKQVKKTIIYIVGAIWCVAAVYGMYFYYSLVLGVNFFDTLPAWAEWIRDGILYILPVVGLIFFFIYDRYVVVTKTFLDGILKRIVK